MDLKIASQQIWLCNQPVDFRKNIDGLSELIHSSLGKEPSEGVYVFTNRRKDKLKLLAWHGNGFVLLYKRLEQGQFTFSKDKKELSSMDATQLSWLVAGLDWKSMTDWKSLEYKDFY